MAACGEGVAAAEAARQRGEVRGRPGPWFWGVGGAVSAGVFAGLLMLLLMLFEEERTASMVLMVTSVTMVVVASALGKSDVGEYMFGLVTCAC